MTPTFGFSEQFDRTMLRYFFFMGLLAFQVVLSTCDEPKVIVVSYLGQVLHLNAPRPLGKLLNCTLKIGEKKLYSIYPEQDITGYAGNDKYCDLWMIAKDFNDAGLWTMTTITDIEKFTTEFEVRTIRQISTKPTNSFDTYVGQWITVWLNMNVTDDVRACNVTSPNKLVFDLMKENIEGISLYGLCGIRMLANKSVVGQWELHAQVGEYSIYKAKFDVSVFNDDNLNSDTGLNKPEYIWNIGKSYKETLNNRKVIFCQLTRPDGSKMPITFESCVLKASFASSYHEGTWKATYVKFGKMQLEHRDIVIKINDPNSITCSYSFGITGEINILCKTGVTNLKVCTFKRPDNYLLYLPAGIGNDNYSYYGNGYSDMSWSSNDYAECGVKIHKPSAVDFGLWTCEISMESRTIQGSVIYVVKTRSGEKVRGNIINYPPVFVKRGDSFKIKCDADAKIKYCWLTSPNGTAYSISMDKASGKTLKYNGKGFVMGECGAVIPTSNDTDSGDWTCHLGIEEGFEVEAKVSVKVTDSYLIANNDIVYAGKETKLMCRTFIGEEGTLRYCRWVRPNGHGINMADASRYIMTQGIDQCNLTVLELYPEDVGKWTCVASITRTTNEEMWATVQLKSTENVESKTVDILTIVLGSGLLIITVIGAFYAALHIYRRNNNRVTKSPPPYYTVDNPIPNEIQTGSHAIPNKDYRY